MRVPAWQVAEPGLIPADSREVLVLAELVPTSDSVYAGTALVDRLTPIELPAPAPAPAPEPVQPLYTAEQRERVRSRLDELFGDAGGCHDNEDAHDVIVAVLEALS